MSGLVAPNGAPLSQRGVRKQVDKQQEALVTLTMAMHLFLRLNFWGRLRWFLFGARIFGPPPAPPAEAAAGSEA